MRASEFYDWVTLGGGAVTEELLELLEKNSVRYCVVGGQAVIQTDPCYSDFVERAERGNVLGIEMPVAAVRDVLRGKVWAAQDPSRRASKRRKDLLDIERLIESYPALRGLVPQGILTRLDL